MLLQNVLSPLDGGRELSLPGSSLTFIEILPVEGFSHYLFVFLGDIRTYVANFKMQEGLIFFLAL